MVEVAFSSGSLDVAVVAMRRSLMDFERAETRLASVVNFASFERGYFASDFSGG
jgi:hypothetical protein